MDWEHVKATISLWTDLERDALHIYAAMIVQIGAALLFRRSLASPLPLLAVLAAELLNEVLDTYRDHVAEAWERAAALHDIWNTMLFPIVLVLLVRFAPRLFAVRRPSPPSQ